MITVLNRRDIIVYNMGIDKDSYSEMVYTRALNRGVPGVGNSSNKSEGKILYYY